MGRHRREHVEALDVDRPRARSGEGPDLWDDEHDTHARDVVVTDDDDDDWTSRPDLRRRRSSDPTPSRPPTLQRNRHRSRDDVSASSSSGPDVEDLPPRFDPQGRPLDGPPTTSPDRWITRRGAFRRERHRPGGWDVQGAWQVSGTDGQAVDRIVRGLTAALDGRASWAGLLGDVLASGVLLAGDPRAGSSRGRRGAVDERGLGGGL
ncbi:hypothetical protein E4U41_005591 [Claviceps citrina]|nr:hypothetical protein E4U41_005591 [Claviceps citrina]